MSTVSERLQSAWSNLKFQWETSSTQWNDDIRDRFDKEYISLYEGIINKATKQCETLEQVISQAKNNVP